ncbi:MAG: 2-oxoacid:acceptor oxidoreductase subunit alpha [Bacillota bacterium]
MYNLLIGGAAGQGVDTLTAMLERILKRAGNNVFTYRDLMSRIRGGHNFSLIRFGVRDIASHSYVLDGMIALNEETIELHKDKVKSNGFILCDSKLILPEADAADPRLIKLPLSDTAKELGNAVVAGSIALGAALKLMGEGLEQCADVLALSVKSEFVGLNLKAFEAGFGAVEVRFAHGGGRAAAAAADAGGIGRILLNGNKAIALGALAAGLKFYSAYPMSPSTSIMEYLSSKMIESGVVVEQAEDEIAAINMAIGASYAGATAMIGTSGGGFCLMVEALGLSGMAEIPLVIVNVQRPGPTTGLPTRTEQSDLKFVVSASQGEFPRMVIAVKNQEDCFYQTIRAFTIAEKYQIPVIILSDQYVGDSTATLNSFDLSGVSQSGLNESCEPEYLRYRYSDDGVSPRKLPGNQCCFVTADSDEHDEHGMITESADVRVRMMDKRMKKLELLQKELQEPEFLGDKDFETLLIGWGSTWGPISEAITLLNSNSGMKFGALVFGDVFPLPTEKITQMAARAKRIINIEQNATGQLAGLIREYTGVQMTGSVLKYDGRQICADEIVAAINKEVGK